MLTVYPNIFFMTYQMMIDFYMAKNCIVRIV